MLVGVVIDGVDVPEDGADAVDHAGELLLKVADGDQSAFARLYDMLSPRAFGLILRVLVDRSQRAKRCCRRSSWRSGNPPGDLLRTRVKEDRGC